MRREIPSSGQATTRRVVALVAFISSMITAGNPASAATGETVLVSVGVKSNNAGAAAYIADPAVSANGRYVFIARRNGTLLVLRDVWRGTYETVDELGGVPQAITPDARYLLYHFGGQVLIRDRQAGITERVSVNSSGVDANDACITSAVTKDGRFVVFTSLATNLAPAAANGLEIFVRDRLNHTTERLGKSDPFSLQYTGYSNKVSISDDGRFVVFEGEGPAPLTELNVFLYDRQAQKIERVSIAENGNAFASTAGSFSPVITPNGRYVAFASYGSNLGPADKDGSDIFVRDRATGIVTRESYGPFPWVRGIASSPSISADGRFVAFDSLSWNLVPNDTNNLSDVFVRDRKTGTLERVSVASDGSQSEDNFQGNAGAYDPSISRDGRWVVFGSRARDLVPNDFNLQIDAYIHDRGPVAP